MKVLGVNGIRTDGRGNTDALLADLGECGWTVQDVNYPRVWALTARSRRRQYDRARYLVEAHAPGDAVVAHSYGCLLTLRAMELGASFGAVFWFAPAMDADYVIPIGGARRVFVIHDPRDRAIALGSLLWWHDFGEMGRCGYRGPPDPRVVNVRADIASEARDPWKHSHYFADPERGRWLTFVDRRLREAV